MFNKLIFLFFICISGAYSFSQHYEYLVFFDDKPIINQNELSTKFSPKALEKKKAISYDFYDLPISKNYLSQLKKNGKIINKSKWLNAVHYSSTIQKENLQKEFPFISHFIEVNPIEIDYNFMSSIENETSLTDTLLYNNSYDQLEITSTISCMHNKGFDGDGILIAVLDAGFPKMDSMLAFEKMRNQGRIIDTWDFEDNNSFVYHKSNHGTYVSSIVGGQLDSLFIGSAPKSDYAFYITEITRFERNIEEFNLVLGLERADSVGADICSISLGYRNFDTLQLSYSYSGMDGKTTIVAQGVTIARNKGLIISTAAGNSGSGIGTLSSPCDADSILCVGAINYDSTRAGFSSEGPTFDGRIKPEVVTIGRHCYYVYLDDSIRNGNGTSFSTPLFSGLVACIKQAHPLRTNFQIIDAIIKNSHLSSTPDNIYGYGIPNACKIDSALTLLDSVILSTDMVSNELKVSIYPNPTTDFIYIKTQEILNEYSIIGMDGKLIKQQQITNTKQSNKIDVSYLPHGIYLLKFNSIDNRIISKKILIN